MTPLTRIGGREASEFLGLPLRLRRPKSPVDGLRLLGVSEHDIAVTRLACSWLLVYPDGELLERLDGLAAAVAELPEPLRTPLAVFLDHLDGTVFIDHLSPWHRRLLWWRLKRLAAR